MEKSLESLCGQEEALRLHGRQRRTQLTESQTYDLSQVAQPASSCWSHSSRGSRCMNEEVPADITWDRCVCVCVCVPVVSLSLGTQTIIDGKACCTYSLCCLIE